MSEETRKALAAVRVIVAAELPTGAGVATVRALRELVGGGGDFDEDVLAAAYLHGLRTPATV